MAEYKVGDRVGAKVYDYDYNKHLVIGTITKIDGKRCTFVKDGDHNGYDARTVYQLEQLIPEAEALAQIEKIKQARTIIETQTKPLLDNATALIHQAAKIARDNDQYLSDMHGLVQPLLGAIDAAGWSSSAMTADC